MCGRGASDRRGRLRIAAYVYPGWHPTPERDEALHPGFTEWELVAACRPRFAGHAQPRVPMLGAYDDRNPREVGRRVQLACEYGVDAFVYGFFWCRGKRVFGDALDRGFLGSSEGRARPFAVMWANRMPRHILPVRRADVPVIEEERRVSSDELDFVALMSFVSERYFRLPNYMSLRGLPYFSIYDSTFFLRELGLEGARTAIARAREQLRRRGHLGFHLAAIDPSPEVTPELRTVGFDSVTHYVHLPEWKGPPVQDYTACAAARATEWQGYAARSGLPYMPSVATGWDASPRAADWGPERPDKYPWSPVVTGEHPRKFQEALERALAVARVGELGAEPEESFVFVASLNEWSEGHYLEPDRRHGNGWLQALSAARSM